MVKLMELKRKEWQSETYSKLQNCKIQTFLPFLSSLFSSLRFRRKQEKEGKNPKTTLPREEEVEDVETHVVVELPDDLTEDILHRIPAKHLVRWKAVSKGWKALLESDHLAKKHLRRRQKKYGPEEVQITVEWCSNSTELLYKYFSKHKVSIRENNRESEALPRVCGSCHGLVCVYDSVYVYISNPLTRVNRTLTPPLGTKLSMGFGKDVVTTVGFGRDVVRGTYKVVVLYSFGNDDKVETRVLDLSTTKWRHRYKTAGPLPLSFTLINPKRNPVFVNGSLFWLSTHLHSEILVMDLHTEKFRTVLQPKGIDVSSGLIYMWTLEGRLCVGDLRQGFGSDLWVFVQDDVSERWERTTFPSIDNIIPPLKLNSAWFSPSLVSPYQSSNSDTCLF